MKEANQFTNSECRYKRNTVNIQFYTNSFFPSNLNSLQSEVVCQVLGLLRVSLIEYHVYSALVKICLVVRDK